MKTKTSKKRTMAPLNSYNFDWDDNILFMPTKIILFHKETRAEVAISTHEFAHVRQEVGVKGTYQDYELINEADGPYFSYREFRDKKEPYVNTFLPQVKEALSLPNCFGPSFQAFCEALSNPVTAKLTTIITARGHNPESMLEALNYFKELGYIKHLPPLENIYPVSSPKIKAQASHPSEKKLEILMGLIDQMEQTAKLRHENSTFFGFSDDDHGTYKIVREQLEKQAKVGRWSHVRVVLYFTGKNPETKMLTSDGYVDFVETVSEKLSA